MKLGDSLREQDEFTPSWLQLSFWAGCLGSSPSSPTRLGVHPTFREQRTQSTFPRRPLLSITHSLSHLCPSLTWRGLLCWGSPPVFPRPVGLVFTASVSEGRFECTSMSGLHFFVSPELSPAFPSSQPPGLMLWAACVPTHSSVEALTPGPQSMTVFGDRVFTKVIRVKLGCVGVLTPVPGVRVRRGN